MMWDGRKEGAEGKKEGRRGRNKDENGGSCGGDVTGMTAGRKKKTVVHGIK
jgi:hypothetical protein